MRKIAKISKLKFVTFAHIERETPIVEVLYRGKIVFDVSFKNDNASNAIEILFSKDIDGLIFDYEMLNQIIEIAIEKLRIAL